MKRSFFILLAFVIIFISCKKQFRGGSQEELIKRVESHLSPAVRVEGELISYYSIEERMNYFNIPGVSIAFIEDEKIAWTKQYGYTGGDVNWPVTESTVFQAASISKPVSAIAALQLFEDEGFDLDRDLNDYLTSYKIPESRFTQNEKVTLRRLLSHSAGFNENLFEGYSKWEEIPELNQILYGLYPSKSGPITPFLIPGTLFYYSSGGYTILQQLITDITGKSFSEYMDERIFSRLNMNHSTFVSPLPKYLCVSPAVGHYSDGESIKGNWLIYPQLASSGLWSTASDLAKLIIELQKSFNNKYSCIFSNSVVKMFLSRQIDDFGLGFFLDGAENSLMYSHTGNNCGYRSKLLVFANKSEGVVVMTNSDNGTVLIDEIIRSLSYVYDWGIYASKVKRMIYLDHKTLQKFEGVYNFDSNYDIAVSATENGLFIKQLWNRKGYYVFPESDLRFFVKELDFVFKFSCNEDGDISELTSFGNFKFKKQR